MSNCFGAPDDSKDEQPVKAANARGCTDVLWLIVYIIFWLLMVRHDLKIFTHLYEFIKARTQNFRLAYQAFVCFAGHNEFIVNEILIGLNPFHPRTQLNK